MSAALEKATQHIGAQLEELRKLRGLRGPLQPVLGELEQFVVGEIAHVRSVSAATFDGPTLAHLEQVVLERLRSDSAEFRADAPGVLARLLALHPAPSAPTDKPPAPADAPSAAPVLHRGLPLIVDPPPAPPAPPAAASDAGKVGAAPDVPPNSPETPPPGAAADLGTGTPPPGV